MTMKDRASVVSGAVAVLVLAGLGCEIGHTPSPASNADERPPLSSANRSQPPTPGDEPPISFGVVPQQSAAKLARLWRPVLEDISSRTGVTLRFATAPDIPTFEERLASGEYDISYMNPYHYTVFSRSPGYRVFAREKGKRIRGIVVVRKDSPISALEELDGRAMAFPAPAAFAASILLRAHFKRRNWRITPTYVSSHDSVYRAVAKGLYPAGGGVPRTFDNMDAGVREQLRVLWKTDGHSPHAIAAHPRVDVAVVAAVREALLAMEDDPDSLTRLHALNFQGLQAAEDSEWDDVRALGIDLLDDLITGGK